MVISLDALDADFVALRDDLPETATFEGSDYAVIRTNRMTDLQSRRSDFIEDYVFTLGFRIRDFDGGQPTEGKIVTHNTIDYRVLSVEESADAIELRVNLAAKHSRGR